MSFGKRGKPKPLDWWRYWSAQCKAILTLADDRVRRAKELRKVKGALRAALKRGDLMEAEQVRKVMAEKFDVTDLKDDSASDPEKPADD